MDGFYKLVDILLRPNCYSLGFRKFISSRENGEKREMPIGGQDLRGEHCVRLRVAPLNQEGNHGAQLLVHESPQRV